MLFNTTNKRAKRLAECVLVYTKNQQSRKLCRDLGLPDDRFGDFFISLLILNSFVASLYIEHFLRNNNVGVRMNNLIFYYLNDNDNRYKVLPENVIKVPEEITFYNQQPRGNIPSGIELYKCSSDSATIFMIIYDPRINHYEQIAIKLYDEIDRVMLVLAHQFYHDVYGTYPHKSNSEVLKIRTYLMMFSVELMNIIKEDKDYAKNAT